MPVTLVRCTPIICARNSCVNGSSFPPTRSYIRMSHLHVRCSTLCSALQAVVCCTWAKKNCSYSMRRAKVGGLVRNLFKAACLNDSGNTWYLHHHFVE